MKQKDVINGRDDAGVHYKGGGMVHEEITKGRDCEEGGHYKRTRRTA